VRIESTAVSLPKVTLTNDDLIEKFPNWDFDRLGERAGVLSRQVVADNETAYDLALNAARNLLKKNKNFKNNIGALLYCTSSPDYPIPGDAARLSYDLGFSENQFVLDVNSGCSAYPYLLSLANGLIATNITKNVIVVTSDTYSRWINPSDRSTRILFGDGAAASLIVPDVETFHPVFGSKGDFYDRFWVKSGGARNKINVHSVNEDDRFIKMEGLKVLSFFNSKIPDLVVEVCEMNGKNLDDIDAFIFHQASRVALDGIQRALNIPNSKMVRCYQQTGNLVSSSVPFAINFAKQRGIITEGNLVLLCGFGVGLSWGATLIKT